MKTWLAVGLAAVLGIGAGVVTALVRVHQYPWDGTPQGAQSGSEAASPAPAGPLPKVVVEQDTYDFGDMDATAKGRHEFVFMNTGLAPLMLREGPSSCKCTAAILHQGRILPGESGVVAVEWTGKEYSGHFTQTATVETNDPTREQVTLTIKGRLTVAVRAAPSELTLTGIMAGEERSAEMRLFGFRSDPLKIVGHELLDPSTAEKFEVALEPLPPDQFAEEEGATSGLLVEVKVKPGLPLGAFQQRILLKTNYREAPTIEVPVRGTVTSEIAIVGKGWNEQTGVLVWGNVKSEEGAQRDLFIRVGGPHHKEVSFKPIEVFPDLLKVKLGETKHLENGRIALTPLTIQIPKGSPPANYLRADEENLGRIILETSHPKARQLRILVRFSVQG